MLFDGLLTPFQKQIIELKKAGVIVIHKCVAIKHALTAQRLGVDMVTLLLDTLRDRMLFCRRHRMSNVGVVVLVLLLLPFCYINVLPDQYGWIRVCW